MIDKEQRKLNKADYKARQSQYKAKYVKPIEINLRLKQFVKNWNVILMVA